MPKYKNILELSQQSLKRRWKKRFKLLPRSSTEKEKTNVELLSDNSIDSIDNIVNESPSDNINELQSDNSIDSIVSQSRSDNINESNEMLLIQDEIEENAFESKENVISFLKNWTFDFNITRVALNSLLKFLKRNGFYYLPEDSRTLFQTPKSREIVEMNPGYYCHVGVKKGLDYNMAQLSTTNFPNEIELDFNIDGVPISKSSKSSFWLILARIVHLKQIFVVGVYHGYKKPDSFPNFLRMFVDELKILTENYSYNCEKIQVKVKN